jgi:hypothetical protein
MSAGGGPSSGAAALPLRGVPDHTPVLLLHQGRTGT